MYPRQYLYNDAHGLIRNAFHLQDYIRDDLINSTVEIYFFFSDEARRCDARRGYIVS